MFCGEKIGDIVERPIAVHSTFGARTIKSPVKPATSLEGQGTQRQFPLRFLLIVPFLLQIAAVVGLTGYFSWRNGQKTVASMAIRLSNEITAHVEKHVLNYTNAPAQFIDINRGAIRAGALDVNDPDTLLRYFWEQTQVSDSVPYVYFGNPQGEFVGVWKQSDLLTTSRLRTTATAPYRVIARLDSGGNAVEEIARTSYDPRVRPWYREAVAAEAPIWTPIYLFARPASLGITHAIPVYDESESLVGVLGTDITLSQLSDFLQDTRVSESGQVFIIERSGDLVATSADERPFIENDTAEERLAAVASGNPLIRETTQYVLDRFASFEAISTQQALTLTIGNQRQFIEITPVNSQTGIDWLLVVAIPEADFNQFIRANTFTTLGLCLVALVLATGLGLVTSQWIARPIRRLSRASQMLATEMIEAEFRAENQSQPGLDGAYILELGTMARAFNQMAAQLYRAFCTLTQVNAELEQRVDERTQALRKANKELEQFVRLDELTQVANRRRLTEYLESAWRQQLRSQQPLSVILCDVDRFKQYNDTYGHPAGDECLKRIAQALQVVMHRPADLVARYGGEEFAIVLPLTDLAGATHVAERLRTQVRVLEIAHRQSDIAGIVTISVGVSCCRVARGLSIAELIERADRALYRAKAEGRDRVVALPLQSQALESSS